RGYWWAPDGSALLVARVDETPVQRWYIADPANPGRPPTQVAYPAAGTPNADVSLLLVGPGGGRTGVEWDRTERTGFPYLATVAWDSDRPLIVVQSRDQRRMRLLTADPASGATAVLREETDQHWVDIVAGVPARTGDDRIVWATDGEGARRLLAATAAELGDGGAKPVTPPTLQVRDVLDTDGDAVLFTASGDDPAEIGLWLHRPSGLAQLTTGPGVQGGRRAGGTTVVISRSMAEPGATVRVVRDGHAGQVEVRSLAERPNLPAPSPEFFVSGPRAVPTALLL